MPICLVPDDLGKQFVTNKGITVQCYTGPSSGLPWFFRLPMDHDDNLRQSGNFGGQFTQDGTPADEYVKSKFGSIVSRATLGYPILGFDGIHKIHEGGYLTRFGDQMYVYHDDWRKRREAVTSLSVDGRTPVAKTAEGSTYRVVMGGKRITTQNSPFNDPGNFTTSFQEAKVIPGAVIVSWEPAGTTIRQFSIGAITGRGDYRSMQGPTPRNDWRALVLTATPFATPRVGDDVVFFGGGEGRVYATNAKSDKFCVRRQILDRGELRVHYYEYTNSQNGRPPRLLSGTGPTDVEISRILPVTNEERRARLLEPPPAVGQIWQLAGEHGSNHMRITKVGRQYLTVDIWNEESGRSYFTCDSKLPFVREGTSWYPAAGIHGGPIGPPRNSQNCVWTPDAPPPYCPVPQAGQVWKCRDPRFIAVISENSVGSPVICFIPLDPRAGWRGRDNVIQRQLPPDSLYDTFYFVDGPSHPERSLDYCIHSFVSPRVVLDSNDPASYGFRGAELTEPLVSWIASLYVPVDSLDPHREPLAAARANSYTCDRCSCVRDSRVSVETTTQPGGATLCMECMRACSRRCESCGNPFMSLAAAPGPDCLRCTDENRVNFLRKYNYRPEPVFHGDDPLQFGCELELGFGSDSPLEDISALITREMGGLVYCKSDGSIGHGIEMVTHPFSLDWMHQNYDKFVHWFSLFIKAGASANGSCGMHIHTSRAGYVADPATVAARPGIDPKQRALQLGTLRVQRLIYSNPRQVTLIAGRQSEEYASLTYSTSGPGRCRLHTSYISRGANEREIVSLAKVTDSTKKSRYSALNVLKNTIEFRVFESTTDLEKFFARVEFTHAVITYCRTRKLPRVPDFRRFAQWVLGDENEDTYRYFRKVFALLLADEAIGSTAGVDLGIDAAAVHMTSDNRFPQESCLARYRNAAPHLTSTLSMTGTRDSNVHHRL